MLINRGQVSRPEGPFCHLWEDTSLGFIVTIDYRENEPRTPDRNTDGWRNSISEAIKAFNPGE